MIKELVEFLNSIKSNLITHDEEPGLISICIGCDLNRVELEKVKALIKNQNPIPNIILINTCVAYQECTDVCNMILKYVKDNCLSKYKVYIIGCGFDYFKDLYPEFITIDKKNQYDIEAYNIPKGNKYESYAEKALGLVKIQSGCNCACSYCQIFKIRGKSISEPKEEIVKEIQRQIDLGIKDITLTGVNVSQYEDPNDKSDLLLLLYYIIHNTEGLKSLQTYSIDPAWDRIFDLIEFIKNEPKMAKMLYLAAQSGSTSVLKRMGRKHDEQRLLDIIKQSNGIKLRYDIIVGHPGETEEDFRKTLHLIKLSQNHSMIGGQSKFTAHPGTASYYMEDKVPEEVIDERFDRLIALENELIKKVNQ